MATAQEENNQDQEDLRSPSSSSLERYNDDSGSSIAVRSLDDIKRISTIFIGSGMFKGTNGLSREQQLYQAGVKIIAGVEFGIQPFAAMRGINIIKGNAEMSANLMAAKVKKHPKYDYRIKQWDLEGCVIDFYEIPYPGATREKWDLLGPSSFGPEDAQAAGLANDDNWRKFARNMYFARAMSNGVRIYTPDVFYGAPVYVDGEISGEFAAGKAEPSKQPQEPVEAEVIEQDPDSVVHRDIAEEQAQIESESEDQPAQEAPADDDPLGDAKRQINEALEAQGYTNAVSKKAFVLKVLRHSTIENLNEAEEVMAQLENES